MMNHMQPKNSKLLPYGKLITKILQSHDVDLTGFLSEPPEEAFGKRNLGLMKYRLYNIPITVDTVPPPPSPKAPKKRRYPAYLDDPQYGRPPSSSQPVQDPPSSPHSPHHPSHPSLPPSPPPPDYLFPPPAVLFSRPSDYGVAEGLEGLFRHQADLAVAIMNSHIISVNRILGTHYSLLPGVPITSSGPAATDHVDSEAHTAEAFRDVATHSPGPDLTSSDIPRASTGPADPVTPVDSWCSSSDSEEHIHEVHSEVPASTDAAVSARVPSPPSVQAEIPPDTAQDISAATPRRDPTSEELVLIESIIESAASSIIESLASQVVAEADPTEPQSFPESSELALSETHLHSQSSDPPVSHLISERITTEPHSSEGSAMVMVSPGRMKRKAVVARPTSIRDTLTESPHLSLHVDPSILDPSARPSPHIAAMGIEPQPLAISLPVSSTAIVPHSSDLKTRKTTKKKRRRLVLSPESSSE